MVTLGLGLACGYGIYRLLHVEFVHELVSEQLPLDDTANQS